MNYNRLTAISNAVTLQELKDHLRIAFSDQDTYLQVLLNAAQKQIENAYNVVMLPATYEFTIAKFENSLFPVKPVNSITKIEYKDTAGNMQTIAGTSYTLLKRWPRQNDAVQFENVDVTNMATLGENITITAECGYTETPADIKAAVLLIAGRMYENPADPVDEKETTADKLMKAYKY